MISEIKDFFGSEIDESLELYRPEISDNFGFIIDLEIGIIGQEGADLFYVMLCTPKWLIENMKQEEIIVGLHYMIVFEYNYEKIHKKLAELFCFEGKDWDEIANKLSYFGQWEFQDYQEWGARKFRK
jgi:hypothetical protein